MAQERPAFWSSKVHGFPLQESKKKMQLIQMQVAAVPPTRVTQIEKSMRDGIEKITPRNETTKTILIRAFDYVARYKEGRSHRKIGLSGFQNVCQCFGVNLNDVECRAMFAKYGQDEKGRLPYDMFALRLFTSENRQLSWKTFQNGPYKRGLGQNYAYNGKIRYAQTKKGVYPPSDWDGSAAIRSLKHPSASLQLEFVYGYAGLENYSPNLFYTSSGEVVYYTAALGIVYAKDRHDQRFFLGHEEDIKSISIDASKNYCCTGDIGKNPTARVWDCNSMQELACLVHPDMRGIYATAFSPDGAMMVTVGTDNPHTVHIWNWRKGQLMGQGVGYQQMPPPQVFGAKWDPFAKVPMFATWGVNHIKFWSAKQGEKNPWDAPKAVCGTFGNFDLCKQLCLEFLPDGTCITGTDKGALYIWVPKDKQRAECRVIKLRMDNSRMLTGGVGGVIKTWQLANYPAKPKAIRKTVIASAYKREPAPNIRALDCEPGSQVFVVGTHKCDIWEVTPGEVEKNTKANVLITGHMADLTGLDAHPYNPNIFVTSCDSERIYLWEASNRGCINSCQVGSKTRSVAFSPNAKIIAVGLALGGVKIVDVPEMKVVGAIQLDGKSEIDELKFSPQGNTLAIASHDQMVYFYDVGMDPATGRCNGKLKFLGKGEGHSATVAHVDFSSDGKIVQSTCNAYEILYWNARNGNQITEKQNDTDWHTYTTKLGFGVMGIWADIYGNNTDINSLDRSHNRKFCVASDDKGQVVMWNFPCVVEKADYKAYGGHASHVTRVRWLCDDQRVVSIGGHDRATMQWKVLWSEKEPYEPFIHEARPTKSAAPPRPASTPSLPGPSGALAEESEVAMLRAELSKKDEQIKALQDQLAELQTKS